MLLSGVRRACMFGVARVVHSRGLCFSEVLLVLETFFDDCGWGMRRGATLQIVTSWISECSYEEPAAGSADEAEAMVSPPLGTIILRSPHTHSHTLRACTHTRTHTHTHAHTHTHPHTRSHTRARAHAAPCTRTRKRTHALAHTASHSLISLIGWSSVPVANSIGSAHRNARRLNCEQTNTTNGRKRMLGLSLRLQLHQSLTLLLALPVTRDHIKGLGSRIGG
jgi:hypothetical protein